MGELGREWVELEGGGCSACVPDEGFGIGVPVWVTERRGCLGWTWGWPCEGSSRCAGTW